jgi:hypothetical protein
MNDRPSAWGYGLGLGMAVTGGILAVHVQAGTVVPQWWVFYPSLIVAVMGVTVGLSGLGHGVTWGLELAERVREFRTPPAPVLEYEPDPEPDEPDTDALEESWRLALRRFFHNGEVAGGFSHRRLESSMTEDAWTELTTFYSSDDGGRVLRLTPQGYVLGYAVTYDTLLKAINQNRLPHPKGTPPEVSVLPDDATRRDARRQREGVRA